jgi:hypothetical protein
MANKHNPREPMVYNVKVMAYPLVGNWVAWKIGNGGEGRIGEDP